MTQDQIDEHVDNLLARWHWWSHSVETVSEGYRSVDSTCRDAESQWSYHDRENGTLDSHIENELMEGVDRSVDAIPNHPRPWHTMILIEARNLVSGAIVWSSARLPANADELEVLRLEARTKLARELQRNGCLGF